MATAASRSDTGETGKTQTGLDENVAATLAYVLGWVTGIVMYFIESDNETVQFHAAQSVVVFGGVTVAAMVLNFLQVMIQFGDIVGVILGPILGLVSLALWLGAVAVWIYLLVQTYQDNDPRIPVAAGIAEDLG